MKRRPSHAPYLSSPSWVSPGPLDPQERWCNALDLEQAVRTLPERMQTVACLVALELTQREMAELLGVSLATAHRLRKATLGALRRELGEEDGHV